MAENRNRYQPPGNAPGGWYPGVGLSAIRLLVKVGVIVLYLVFITSCGLAPFYATGRKFDTNRVPEIVEQQTTRNEIVQIFGDPVQTNLADATRASWWRYDYTYLGVLEIETASLEIDFDEDRVASYRLEIDRRRY